MYYLFFIFLFFFRSVYALVPITCYFEMHVTFFLFVKLISLTLTFHIYYDIFQIAFNPLLFRIMVNCVVLAVQFKIYLFFYIFIFT